MTTRPRGLGALTTGSTNADVEGVDTVLLKAHIMVKYKRRLLSTFLILITRHVSCEPCLLKETKNEVFVVTLILAATSWAASMAAYGEDSSRSALTCVVTRYDQTGR